MIGRLSFLQTAARTRVLAVLAVLAVVAATTPGIAGADAAPVPGAFAPTFALPDQSGKERRLEEWRGRWVVLYFYPKDDTPGCTTEAQAFRDQQGAFSGLRAEVVGISVDDPASHRAFAEKHGLRYALLADVGGSVSRRYGALTDLGVLKFAKRHTFLLDPDGRVAKVYQKVEADRHAGEVIGDLKDLQTKP